MKKPTITTDTRRI